MTKYLVISLLTLASPALAYGAEWYVDLADGTLGAACTATDPCLVFNDTLGVGFTSGDTINVRGTTTDDVMLNSNGLDGTASQPTLITAWPDETAPTLSGTNAANLGITAGSYMTLDGFIISNGNVGVEINNDGGTTSNITLRNFVVRSNGIGINLSEVESVTVQNSIIAQSTSQGIDVGQSIDVAFVNNLIAANTDDGLRILAENTNPVVYHNVISGNSTGLEIQNLTTGALVYNNILYGNDTAVDYSAGTVSGADYNDYYANTTISPGYATLAALQVGLNLEMNSLEVDPVFVDPDATEPDLHLQATSPLIDAGYDTSAVVTTDGDDETRPYGAGADIGFDELPVVPTPTQLKVKKITAHQALVKWQTTTGYDVTKYKIEYSRKKSFTNAKQVGTTKTKKLLTKLKAGTRYFVRVKAIYKTDYSTYKSAKTSAKKFTTLDLSN